MKFDSSVFFENLSRKFKCYQLLTRMTATLREHKYTFTAICLGILPRMRNTAEKKFRDNQNPRLISHNNFPKPMTFMGYCGNIW